MIKRFISIMIVAVFAMSLEVPAMAAISEDNAIAQKALDEVAGLYTDVYTISDGSVEIIEKTQDAEGNTEYIVAVAFKRTLKVTDAEEIPAIQGMIRAKELLSDPEEIKAAETYISGRIADMEDNYIGVAQDTNVMMRVTVPAVMTGSVMSEENTPKETFEVESALERGEYEALQNLVPRSAAEQYEAGIALVEEIAVSDAAVMIASTESTSATPHNERIYYYDRVKARDYARDWSCTKATVGEHSTCHNPDYKYFEGDEGTDCTNFVSQCLCEGGLKPDDTWYPYSSYWTTTGNRGYGIRQYVTNNDLFFATDDINRAFAGSIINLLNKDGTNAGHVGLIDQNDFYTVTLCAHDSCRSSYPVTNWTYKNYYVPYYDSHADQWIEP
jgi:hypothetical protein